MIFRNWNGPVLGGAGTGKTVVAMHRAAWLVRHVLADGEKVLFTTFTANLATDIEQNLKKLCSTEEMARIDIKHIDGWVSDFLRKQKYPLQLFTRGRPNDISRSGKSRWRGGQVSLHCPRALSRGVGAGHSDARVLTRDDYFRASRKGRGVALNRKQRAAICQCSWSFDLR